MKTKILAIDPGYYNGFCLLSSNDADVSVELWGEICSPLPAQDADERAIQLWDLLCKANNVHNLVVERFPPKAVPELHQKSIRILMWAKVNDYGIRIVPPGHWKPWARNRGYKARRHWTDAEWMGRYAIWLEKGGTANEE